MSIKKISNYWVYLFLLAFLPVIIKTISINLIIATILLISIVYIIKKKNINKFPLVLFIFSLLLRIIVCLVIKTEPISDFLSLLNASRSINAKDFSFNNDPYYFYWAYQIGFVFIQSLFLKVLNKVLFLKIINSFITSCICVLIYYISKEFIKDEYARVVSIFYSIMIFPLTYVTVLTNQHLSALLMYLAIYILISKKIKLNDNKKYAISGTLISIGNVIRPEGIITITAIILFLIITINKKDLKKTIKKIIILLSTYYIVFLGCSTLFTITKIGPYGLSNNAPYWKLVLGLNAETNGSYSGNDTYVIGDKEAAHNLIKDRIRVKPIELYNLFINKIDIFWNHSTLMWSFSNIYDKKVKIINKEYSILELSIKLNDYNEKCLSIMYVMMIIGIYNYIKKKNWNKDILILINQVFITFGIYLLIEVQPRYAYSIQITTVILMGLGIEFIFEKIDKKNRSWR